MFHRHMGHIILDYLQVSLARPSCDTIKGANLYVSGLPRNQTQSEMDELFSPFGNIVTSRILCDQQTGRAQYNDVTSGCSTATSCVCSFICLCWFQCFCFYFEETYLNSSSRDWVSQTQFINVLVYIYMCVYVIYIYTHACLLWLGLFTLSVHWQKTPTCSKKEFFGM